MSDLALDRAQVLYDLGRYADAREAAGVALSRAPRSSDAFQLLTECYLMESDYQLARVSAERAVECDPSNGWSYFLLAVVFYHDDTFASWHPHETPMRSPTNGEQMYRVEHLVWKSFEANGPFAAGYLLLCSARRSVNDYDNALRFARQALAAEPTSVQAQLEIGEILNWTDHYQASLAAADTALAADPDNPRAHSARAQALLNIGQPKAAHRHANEAARLDPGTFADEVLLESMCRRQLNYRVAIWMVKTRVGNVFLGLLCVMPTLVKCYPIRPDELAYTSYAAILAASLTPLILFATAPLTVHFWIQFSTRGRALLSWKQRIRATTIVAYLVLAGIAITVAAIFNWVVLTNATVYLTLLIAVTGAIVAWTMKLVR